MSDLSGGHLLQRVSDNSKLLCETPYEEKYGIVTEERGTEKLCELKLFFLSNKKSYEINK